MGSKGLGIFIGILCVQGICNTKEHVFIGEVSPINIEVLWIISLSCEQSVCYILLYLFHSFDQQYLLKLTCLKVSLGEKTPVYMSIHWSCEKCNRTADRPVPPHFCMQSDYCLPDWYFPAGPFREGGSRVRWGEGLGWWRQCAPLPFHHGIASQCIMG